jgi:hypothetical protein
MSDENTNVWAVGTLVKETVKTYWFPEGELAGQVITVATALTLFKDFAGRELNSFETGMVLAVPRSGTASVAILMTSVTDPSERNFLKATKRKVAAYVLRIRESGRQQNYGDVIGTDAVYTPDGERVGELTIYRKQEPALEKPFLDPIDLLSVGLAGLVRKALTKLAARITGRLALEVAEAGAARAIANPTLEQVQALVPKGHTLQSWGGMIWGSGANGAVELLGKRTAAQLRLIPGLTIESATTLRNYMFNLGAGKGGVAPAGRIQLLDEIIGLLRGKP